MVALKDMTGMKFNRLTVIKRIPSNDNHANWLCVCDCGKSHEVKGAYLRYGSVKSCGCLKIETSIKNGKNNRTHGMSKGKYKRIYDIFRHMLNRCQNEKDQDYKMYGGRGISVEFTDVIEFIDWAMANGYESHLTIERINVNGNYSPENCTWITNEAQALNRTNSRKFTYKGETKDMRSWSVEYGIKYNTLRGRLTNYGWDIERALLTPVVERG